MLLAVRAHRMAKLEGKVAIVTGAARGLGAATAARLCDEGAAVMLTDVLAEGEATAARLRDAGHRANFRMMDVRDAAIRSTRGRTRQR